MSPTLSHFDAKPVAVSEEGGEVQKLLIILSDDIQSTISLCPKNLARRQMIRDQLAPSSISSSSSSTTRNGNNSLSLVMISELSTRTQLPAYLPRTAKVQTWVR